MKVSFTLPINPFSVNRMYYRDGRIKTQECRDWESTVINSLQNSDVQVKLAKLREHFNESQHSFVVRLTAYYPKSIILNKKGLISSRAEDLSNWEKPLVDILFLPRYHVQPFPAGAKNINADDKYIIALSSRKCVSSNGNHSIAVSIAIVPLAL